MTVATHALRVSRVIQGDAETLFNAWTDPQELMHWWRQEGDGWSFAGASIDLRVGGRYRLRMKGPDGQTHTAVGIYREVERPVRLVFTWDWEDPTARLGDTLVTVEFKNAGDRGTEVILTHERFAAAERMGRHQEGWIHLLNLLERYLDRGHRTQEDR